MATATRATTRRRWDQLYLWVWGVMLLVLGGASLLVHPDFAVGDDVTAEHAFWVLETNGWHGLSGLVAGIGALAFARSDRWAPTAAALVGVLAGLVPSVAFLLAGDGNAALGLIPVDTVDAVVLHVVPGVLGVAAAVAGARQR